MRRLMWELFGRGEIRLAFIDNYNERPRVPLGELMRRAEARHPVRRRRQERTRSRAWYGREACTEYDALYTDTIGGE